MTDRLHSTTSHRFRRLLSRPEVVERYFREHLHDFFPQANALLECTATHRAALSTSSYLTRYVLVVREGKRRVIKHVRGNSVDPKTWQIFRRLGAHRQSVCRFPRPLSYFARPGYIFYEEVAGDTLRQLPWRSTTRKETMEKIGLALSRFHQTPTGGLRRLPWNEERRIVRGMIQNIARLSPARTSWINDVGKHVLRAERAVWNTSLGLVHKDFQASNIILGHPVGVIDFTLTGVGPRMFDLGTFAVHLGVMSLGHQSRKATEQQLQAFYAGYRRSLSNQHWKKLESLLPVFRLRSAIDILSITLTYLGEQSANSTRYIEYLAHTINTQVRDIMTS